jgi:hypothetical protein
MNERNGSERGVGGSGRRECRRIRTPNGEGRGMGVSGDPQGGGRGRCRGGGGPANPAPQEGRSNSSRGSLVNELGRRVEALEQRLAETTQSREAQPRPLEPE